MHGQTIILWAVICRSHGGLWANEKEEQMHQMITAVLKSEVDQNIVSRTMTKMNTSN